MIKNKYRICLGLEDIYSTHTYIKEHLQINLKKKKHIEKWSKVMRDSSLKKNPKGQSTNER